MHIIPFSSTLILFSLTTLNGKQLNLNCDEAYDPDCYRQSLTLNASDSTVRCRGFSSCREAKDVIVSGGDSDDNSFNKQFIYCYGSYSCFNTSSILAISYENNDIHGQIYCYGYQSCSHSSLQSQDSLHCNGALSCAFSTISTRLDDVNSLQLDCTGELSCRDSHIINVNVIQGTGRFSLYNSVILSTEALNSTSEGTELELLLWGHYSGYNASLYCNDIELCKLVCYGTGCYHTKYYCNSAISECDVDCDDDEGNICPIWCGGYGVRDSGICNNIETDIIVDKEISTSFEENNVKCKIGVEYYKTFLCDDYKSCFDTNQSIIIDMGNICCRGSYSCANNNNKHFDKNGDWGIISSQLEEYTEYEVYGNNIICDGYSSCSQTDIINDYVYGTPILMIYCTGAYSCLRLNYTGEEYDGSGIRCVGHYGCQLSDLKEINKVECNGENSCTYSVIKNVEILDVKGYYGIMYGTVRIEKNRKLNMSLSAYWAGSNANIHCEYGAYCYIGCETSEACLDMNVYCNGTCDINCDESLGITCPNVYNISINEKKKGGNGTQDVWEYMTNNVWVIICIVLFIAGGIILCGAYLFKRRRMKKQVLNVNIWNDKIHEEDNMTM